MKSSLSLYLPLITKPIIIFGMQRRKQKAQACVQETFCFSSFAGRAINQWRHQFATTYL